MPNLFQHTGTITAAGLELPYAFGPNQSALLCELRGWEFWQYDEQLLPALHATTAYAALAQQSDADPVMVAEGFDAARKSLFADPRFVQDFYFAALSFGHELVGKSLPVGAAQVGLMAQQEPQAFLPVLMHYVQLQAQRFAVAEVKPVAEQKKSPAQKKRTPQPKPR